jgi:hypothetical protein
MLVATSPNSVGPLGILVVFGLFYLSLLGVVTFLIFYISAAVAKLFSAFTVKQPLSKLGFKQSYYLSTIISAAPVMLIGIQSVGDVSFYDILLVGFFVFVGCFYVIKRSN